MKEWQVIGWEVLTEFQFGEGVLGLITPEVQELLKGVGQGLEDWRAAAALATAKRAAAKALLGACCCCWQLQLFAAALLQR